MTSRFDSHRFARNLLRRRRHLRATSYKLEATGYTLHATILHQLGFNPNQLSYFYGGLNQKLVGVEEVEPIEELI